MATEGWFHQWKEEKTYVLQNYINWFEQSMDLKKKQIFLKEIDVGDGDVLDGTFHKAYEEGLLGNAPKK